MKTLVHRFCFVSALACLLCGCATPGAGVANKSEALQIAHAADLDNLKDVERVEYDNAIHENPDLAGSTAVEAIAVGTGLFNPLDGWDVVGQTNFLSIMSVLSALPSYLPENYHRLLIWMPADEVSDAKAAAVHMRDTIEESYRTALPNYDVELKNRFFSGSGAGERWYLSVDGPGCTSCELYSLTFFNHMPSPRLRKAPEFLGGYDAYVWSDDGYRNSAISGFPGDSAGEETLTPNERMDILTAVSKALPAWVYMYVAPDYEYTGFPLILHQGKPMFFVEPGS